MRAHRMRSTVWAHVLIMSIFFTVVASTPSPVLTIASPDGDLIDCIRLKDQPALQHPLLKNHKIKETPLNNKGGWHWQIWHRNGTECPPGTIPVRRLTTTTGHNETTSSTIVKAIQGHEYAIGGMRNRPKIYGTQATMNVWRPNIERIDEFSLGQIWLTAGSYNTNDINTVEAGWQVYPWLYHDYQPRFFIYWTSDAYNQTGCYNLRCGGFVQTSRIIAVEGAIDETSAFRGMQVEMTIKMWIDQNLGVWWLGVILEHGILEPVGYWPVIIFNRLNGYAERVEWGGEIINQQNFGRHTTTEMGSGYMPDSGYGKAAYMRNLEVALSENVFEPLEDLYVGATHSEYYRAKKSNNSVFGANFYYGGPKQLSLAVHPKSHSSLVYICFAVCFLL